MRLRLASVSEPQLLECLQQGLWGQEGRGYRNWNQDDMLAFIVNKEIAGLSKVTGKQFYSEELIWSNGLFPHRIPIEFTYVLQGNDRLPMKGRILDAVTSAWGKHYGWGILSKKLLPEDTAEMIVNEIFAKPNSLTRVREELTDSS